MAGNTEKLKILCLHGYRQNADVMRMKMGAFRSAMKKHADFVLVDAPHCLDEEGVGASGEPQRLRTWWFNDKNLEDSQIHHSLDYLKSFMIQQGPFDGILAFSQGASMALTLASHIAHSEAYEKTKFIMLFAAFVNKYHNGMLGQTMTLAMKCLLAIGENDNIIPREMSEEVVEHFSDIEVLSHPGGHGIPLKSAQKKTFNRFLGECKTLCFPVPLDNANGILCIHGYRQSGQGFREKTGSFRKSLKKYAEFVFFDAPHRVGAEQGGGDNDQCLGWWFSREDDYYKAVEYSDIDKGFKESVAHVIQFIEEQGPFDGILAFSQGASLLSLLCAMKELGEIELPVGFVMLFAGFNSRCSPHKKYYSDDIQCSIPALLCIGEADEVIPLEMGNQLVKHFKDPVVLHHPGGHFLPNQPDQRKVYTSFLDKQLAVKSAT